MWIALALLAWPLIEIGLFVTLGGAIGLWWTLAIVLGTGVLGAVILRNVARLSGGGRLRDPRMMVLTATRGGMNALAGILLILPGFLTDVLGLILLIPPVQVLVAGVIAARVEVRSEGPQWASPDNVIEGDFERVDPGKPEKPSKWTQD
jgi:UPF0716 protein FxsA